MITEMLPICLLVVVAVTLMIVAWKAPPDLVARAGRRFSSASARERLRLYLWRQGREQEVDPEAILGFRAIAAGAAFLAGAVVWPASFPLAALFLGAGGLLYILPGKYLERKEEQRLQSLRREFPTMVTLLKVFSRAGDLYQAMRVVRGAVRGELKRQLDILAAELEVFPLPEALDNLAKRAGYGPLTNLVGVVLMAIQTGADVEEVLDTFARHAYDERVNEIRRKIKVQPILMAVIPAVMSLSLLLLFVFPMYASIIDRLSAF
ncbi:type II secretion system F family protein [Neomoorella mulderi]|uniref:Bacterial type II secretion system protein F domain protein n=1 Tax=Moorella mulderi DSM 14980 TaxID=1122241 RepID=A0A151AT04_9FIRM|nr:type II secretion system F family protein [Moorella mulderi]KYH30756.1 bacterial type II secretion system protein F domain protein [Moorella mulderi DSM 14980]